MISALFPWPIPDRMNTMEGRIARCCSIIFDRNKAQGWLLFFVEITLFVAPTSSTDSADLQQNKSHTKFDLNCAIISLQIYVPVELPATKQAFCLVITCTSDVVVFPPSDFVKYGPFFKLSFRCDVKSQHSRRLVSLFSR
jgi:hypothetical protein